MSEEVPGAPTTSGSTRSFTSNVPRVWPGDIKPWLMKVSDQEGYWLPKVEFEAMIARVEEATDTAKKLEQAKAALRIIADGDMYRGDFVAKYGEELWEKGSDEIAFSALRALEEETP